MKALFHVASRMSAGGVAQTAGVGRDGRFPAQAGRCIATPGLGWGLDPPNRLPQREPLSSAIPVAKTASMDLSQR